MPKGKRKGRSERYRGGDTTSDDESVNDNASVCSGQSECRSVAAGEEESAETEEQTQIEIFEQKLDTAVMGMTEKSAQSRVSYLEAVCTAFVKKYVPELLPNRYYSICDGVKNGLRKGRSDEQQAAAKLAALLSVQLGAGDGGEEAYKLLQPVLSTTAHDKSVQPQVRGKCCLSLALITFLSGGEMAEVVKTMRHLEQVFCGSYLRGDGSPPSVTADNASMHADALASWSLLLTLLAPSDVCKFLESRESGFEPSLYHLAEMLLSPHLDLRLTAGEALALVYEQGRDFKEEFAEEFSLALIDTLKQLATDSHKYRAKKDRKLQRATFRDVLHFIEENSTCCDQVRLGNSETLSLDSWVRRKQYDSFCAVLGPGLTMHLVYNDLLRDVFEMGPRPREPDVAALRRPGQSKHEKHLMNAASFKARTISRGKNRDKRTAAFNS